MSIDKIDQAMALAADDVDLIISGEQSVDDINAAQTHLGIPLPEDYQYFLRFFGSLNFGDIEIYGLVNSGFDTPTRPNVIWCTLEARKEGLSSDICLIGMNDAGLAGIKSGSDPVIVHRAGMPDTSQSHDEIAPSFGDYLFNCVSQELKTRRTSTS